MSSPINSTSDRPLPATPSRARRAWRAALAGVATAACVWFVPSDSEAAPRCTTKPAVCARLAREKAARATTPAPAPIAVRASAPVVAGTDRCISKPAVCARLRDGDLRPASQPQTVVASVDRTAPCTTKPIVCARLRSRPGAPAVTLASNP